jgi:uncharacterized protein DUF2510
MTSTFASPQPVLQPGWYPDPWSNGMLLRYWSGTSWTPQTRPVPVPPPSKPRKPRKRHVVFSLTFAAFMLAVVVVAITMMRSPVHEVSVGPTKITFGADEIRDRQPAIEQKANEYKASAQNEAGQQPAAAIDLTGNWYPPTGGAFVWQIQQFGNQVVVQEYTTGYGMTGVARGTISGDRVSLNYQSIDWTTGTAELTIVDERTLSGTIVNPTHRLQAALELRR